MSVKKIKLNLFQNEQNLKVCMPQTSVGTPSSDREWAGAARSRHRLSSRPSSWGAVWGPGGGPPLGTPRISPPGGNNGECLTYGSGERRCEQIHLQD